MNNEHKVPKLELSSVTDTIPLSSPCTIQTSIRVLFSNTHALQSDEDMINILEAKRALANRTDVTHYITAEDLLEIQKIKTPIKLRLCIDTDITTTTTTTPTRRISHDETRTKSSPNRVSSNRNSPTRPSSGTRPKLKHKKSVDTSTNVTETTIIINNKTFRVMYSVANTTYQFFMLEEVDGKLLCRGLTDIQIRGDILFSYEYSTINSPGAHMSATIYSKNILNAELPIYLHIHCEHDMTTDRIVCMLPDLINDAQMQYNSNDISHKVNDELCTAWEKK